MTINYVCKNKAKTKHNNNYTDDMTRDTSKDNTNCYCCIFVGENDNVSNSRLCAESMDEISEVSGFGTCDKGRTRFKWYNQINPIKKWLLERTGFRFKNR